MRATRIAKLAPGTLIRVEVVGISSGRSEITLKWEIPCHDRPHASGTPESHLATERGLPRIPSRPDDPQLGIHGAGGCRPNRLGRGGRRADRSRAEAPGGLVRTSPG